MAISSCRIFPAAPGLRFKAAALLNLPSAGNALEDDRSLSLCAHALLPCALGSFFAPYAALSFAAAQDCLNADKSITLGGLKVRFESRTIHCTPPVRVVHETLRDQPDRADELGFSLADIHAIEVMEASNVMDRAKSHLQYVGMRQYLVIFKR